MPTLLLSTWSLPAARALGEAARHLGWQVGAYDENPNLRNADSVVVYVDTDVALGIASRFRLALLEPPLDLLAKLPARFRQRAVEFCGFRDLQRLKTPAFVKPADALNKVFDRGIYSAATDIRTRQAIPPETPVLIAEPVEWLAEYRCFILGDQVVASSPYLSFGRPVWRPYGQGGQQARIPQQVLTFCKQLLMLSRLLFPPAFVVDVGLIEDRGWAVVEFNPAWCSGLLGADPRRVLEVLRRACQNRDGLSSADRRWVLERGATKP